MLPDKCPLLPYAQLHQGVQRVLQIGGFLLLQQEIKMLLFILCSLGAGWSEKFPLFGQRHPSSLLTFPAKKRGVYPEGYTPQIG